MTKTLKPFCRIVLVALTLLNLGLFLTGCEPLEAGNSVTNRPPPGGVPGSDIINVGDAVVITFSDLPMIIPDFKERVKSDGSVTLLYSQKFQFAGKGRGDLEAEIRERYVPAYFNNLTVTIQMPERFYFVDGEVKVPNRYIHSGETTVLKAIASAGGLTDYAKRSNVRLTRANGQSHTVNYDAALENSSLDLPVYAGDKITVSRRYF